MLSFFQATKAPVIKKLNSIKIKRERAGFWDIEKTEPDVQM